MSFEYTTEVEVRYADIDTYGHVNNATYATYFEEARIDYLDDVVDAGEALLSDSGSGVGIVIANLEADYRKPVRISDTVAVAVRVPRLGEKSFPFEYEVRTDEGVAATGETTVVTYDRDTESSRPIPEDWRDAITQFEGL
ncbi:thioesterase family protein [Haloarcula sp. 1CSR25-25]|uniref:acyl-CoA thioesterase n=1 Tax=Haloarcula sp. 1CSR25-25 TaxID=2862545 RepID=UPI002895CB5A|nr:thioesterase family protein [Haloarcula sp. 1CSR25-25]MDT3433371.1 acyl-CoA thioesterase [Haloarcula sp. 1CSR25-25]